MPRPRRISTKAVDFNAAARVAKERAKSALDDPSDDEVRKMGLLVTMQTLSDMGLRHVEIAKVLGKNKKEVERVLDGGAGALARLIITQHAPEMAELWVEAARVAASKGNHVPAADALSAVTDIKSTKDVPSAPTFTVSFGIGLNLPGIPQAAALAAPTSDGFALPALEAQTVEVGS